jgi:hypothetical protein
MNTVEPTPEGFNKLKLALVKARSIAAEGGYLELMGGEFGLDPILAEERHLVLLSELANGERTCDEQLWMNIAYLVNRSAAWSMSLTVLGYEPPAGGLEAIEQFRVVATEVPGRDQLAGSCDLTPSA